MIRRLAGLPFLLGAALCGAETRGGLDGLDEFVATAMKDWSVPGVAIVVVRDGKVVFEKGYGYRDVKKQLPVTSKTLFAIGSASKSFTVTSLGTLVDQGKLDWDKPVREYMPDFKLWDQFATEHMTARDLVTHRSGLPRHDLMWYNSPFGRKEIFERLRYLEPSKDFRTTFQYQNLMFMTAGYLAGQIAGMPWETVVRERIFKPLGMKDSNFSVTDSRKAADYALPYQKVKEVVKEIPFRNIDAIGPAGSINSNLEDMTQYLLMHMQNGKHGDTQVLSESNAKQMQTPQMVIPGELRFAEQGHTSYGMGLFITTYRGHSLVEHGGNIDGFSALLTFMPRDNAGMVILTNLNGTPLPVVLSYSVYDRMLGLDHVRWTERLKDDEKKQKAGEEEAKKQGFTEKRPNTKPSHELKDYAGQYTHPAYGVAKVELVGDRLRFTYNGMSGPLQHFHYDVFEVAEDEENPLSKSKLMFHTGLAGDIESLSAPIEATVKEIVFTRMAESSMTQKSFLEPLAGVYELGPVTATVAMQGEGALTLTVPGQPTYNLEPRNGLRFSIKGLTGFSVEFKKNAAGVVESLVFYQPNGTFVAKRK